jgi:phospholipid-translocating ATPase
MLICSIRLFELHSKTVVTLIGFAISVVGWFLWNVLLSKIYKNQYGIYLVYDEFLYNFGGQARWWATVFIGLGALIILELVVQSVRRVYWPTDQDIMQRIEKEANAKRKRQEMQPADDQSQDMETGIVQREGEEPISLADLRSVADTGGSSGGNSQYDGYRPPNFTPPDEEKESPFETLRNKIRSRGNSTVRR